MLFLDCSVGEHLALRTFFCSLRCCCVSQVSRTWRFFFFSALAHDIDSRSQQPDATSTTEMVLLAVFRCCYAIRPHGVGRHTNHKSLPSRYASAPVVLYDGRWHSIPLYARHCSLFCRCLRYIVTHSTSQGGAPDESPESCLDVLTGFLLLCVQVSFRDILATSSRRPEPMRQL